MVTNESAVLLLNSDFTPIRVIEWKRAVCLLLDQKVIVVSQYADRFIRSSKISLPWPSTIALKTYAKIFCKAKLSKTNIILRDKYTCCYCGFNANEISEQPSLKRLTIDHIVPKVRSKSGIVISPIFNRCVRLNSWQNLVTACSSCNNRKGAKLPAEAGMKLLRKPQEPTRLQLVKTFLKFKKIPQEWEDFI